MTRRVRLGGLAAGVVLFGGFGAQAQPAPMRTVEGLVTSFSRVAIPGAVVYARSASRPELVLQARSDGRGRYAFPGLNLADDYGVWASYRGRNSGVKVVSSLSDRRDVRLDLEIR